MEIRNGFFSMPFPWEKSLFYMAKFLPRFTDKLQIKADTEVPECSTDRLNPTDKAFRSLHPLVLTYPLVKKSQSFVLKLTYRMCCLLQRFFPESYQ
jgi:hypothetical protein